MAYVVGVVIEIPFIDQTWYTGPLVKHLGGADISWIVGLVVSVVLYVAVCRFWPPVGVERAGSRFEPAQQSSVPDPSAVTQNVALQATQPSTSRPKANGRT